MSLCHISGEKQDVETLNKNGSVDRVRRQNAEHHGSARRSEGEIRHAEKLEEVTEMSPNVWSTRRQTSEEQKRRESCER